MWRDEQCCKRVQRKVSFQSEEEVWEVRSGEGCGGGTVYNASEIV